MKTTKKKLPGLKPDHLWEAEHVLVLDGAIILLNKGTKLSGRWHLASFERAGSASFSSEDSLAGAIREAKKFAKERCEQRYDRKMIRAALSKLLNLD